MEIGIAFGWLILSGITLAVAAIARTRGVMIVSLALGTAFLLLQGGCCIVLTRLDRGLGGSGDSTINTASVAGTICFALIAGAIMAKRNK